MFWTWADVMSRFSTNGNARMKTGAWQRSLYSGRRAHSNFTQCNNTVTEQNETLLRLAHTIIPARPRRSPAKKRRPYTQPNPTSTTFAAALRRPRPFLSVALTSFVQQRDLFRESLLSPPLALSRVPRSRATFLNPTTHIHTP